MKNPNFKRKSCFLKWLEKGSTQLESVGRATIDKSLSVKTFKLLDGRQFTLAEDALVSYDGGYYLSITRGSDELKAIEAINQQQYKL